MAECKSPLSFDKFYFDWRRGLNLIGGEALVNQCILLPQRLFRAGSPSHPMSNEVLVDWCGSGNARETPGDESFCAAGAGGGAAI
jgi:hypothetical protein